MPRGDRTGPLGRGPMTGRGAGYCSGFDAPGYARVGAGNYPYGWQPGMGRGAGGRPWGGYGRGFGWGFNR